MEKAKTTPESYPLTVNAIVAGCNQKTNRAPLMALDTSEVEDALHELRQLGAVTEVQGSGRVAKYRHNMYQWLGVDKVEAAVMAELLLRGQQTLGELRGRAARMEPIADLTELKPVIQGLLQKRLVVECTPAGRGQIVTHNLYEERELQAVLAACDGGEAVPPLDESTHRQPSPANRGSGTDDFRERLDSIQATIDQLIDRIASLEDRLG
jgi:uncharacterized protein YceH (UPF0502 family)